MWPQIALALLLTAAATGLVLRETWDDDSWLAMSSLNPRFLLGAAGLLALAWTVDAGRLHAVCRAMGYRISARAALRANFLGYFLAAITPFASGGGPLQVYSLTRAGVPVGYGTAAVLLSGFLAHFSLAVTGILIVFFSDVTIRFDPRIDQWIRAGVLAYTAGLLALAFLVWHVERGRRFIQAVVRWVLRLGTDRERVRAAAAAVDRVIVDLHQGLRTAARRRGWALLGLAAYFVYFAALFSIVPTLAAGLGAAPPYLDVASLLVPVYLFASALPTPGGTGGFEFGLARGLVNYVPAAKIGIIVATWRLLTYYGVVALSGAVVFSFIRGEIARAARGASSSKAASAGVHGPFTTTPDVSRSTREAFTAPPDTPALPQRAAAPPGSASGSSAGGGVPGDNGTTGRAPTAFSNGGDGARLDAVNVRGRANDHR